MLRNAENNFQTKLDGDRKCGIWSFTEWKCASLGSGTHTLFSEYNEWTHGGAIWTDSMGEDLTNKLG